MKDNQLDLMNLLIKKFNDKKWEIDHEDSFFSKFYQMLLNFDKEKQALILNLIDDFIWVRDMQYSSELKKLLDKINISDSSKIYVLPLTSKEDIGKVKSSSFICYLFNSVKKHKKLENKEVNIISTIESLPKNFHKQTNSIMFLVDDFIGTGDTAVSAIEYLEENNIPKEKIIILSLVALSQGLKILKQKNIRIYCNQIVNKGISECEKFSYNIEKYKNLMKDMETESLCPVHYSLGYKESEALVSMLRTPNNTFPIFWYNSKDSKYEAPFNR